MWGFMEDINTKYRLNLQTYDDLFRWSIENIAQFWAETWSFCGVESSQQFEKVGDPLARGHVLNLSYSFVQLSMVMTGIVAQPVAS